MRMPSSVLVPATPASALVFGDFAEPVVRRDPFARAVEAGLGWAGELGYGQSWDERIRAAVEGFLASFMAIPVRVGSQTVRVHAPYFMNAGPNSAAATRERHRIANEHRAAAPEALRAIINDRRFTNARIGKPTPELLRDLLEAAAQRGLLEGEPRAFLQRYGLGIDCSGFVSQAINKLIELFPSATAADRIAHPDSTGSASLKGGQGAFERVTDPAQLCGGDTMWLQGHIRILAWAERRGERIVFCTAESRSSNPRDIGPAIAYWRLTRDAHAGAENFTGWRLERSDDLNAPDSAWRRVATTHVYGHYRPLRRLAESPSSRALYDTGEHVWPGESLYPDQLLVGKAPGVLFSYGDIIAMGDLYETVDEMMAADAAELAGLKKLIRDSLAYYKGGKRQKNLDIKNSQWEKATHKRFLRLAEDNFEHFAPGFLFSDPSLRSPGLSGRDHRSAWEAHHARAIAEAQQIDLDAASARRSAIPVAALIINAFGDHFLTDAFAAGHLLNKGEIIAYVKTRFYSGSALSAAGARFFDKLAEEAWKRGDVAAKFRKLESTAWHHADIDRASRFAEVLKGAAVKEPDRVANLMLKALHDKLNEDGFWVENDAGSGPWKLTGDGFLTQKSLDIMKLAVAQSAANITDPSILASNLDVSRYQAKVWKYVPHFTAASQASVRALATSFIDPSSRDLLEAAAEIVKDQAELLVDLAKKKGELRSIDRRERARDSVRATEPAE